MGKRNAEAERLNHSQSENIFLYDNGEEEEAKGNKRWQARVLNETKRSPKGHPLFVTRSFHDKRGAERWAREEQTKLRGGKSTTGRADALAVGTEYLAHIALTKAKASNTTRKGIRRVVEALMAFNLGDLRKPLALQRAQLWLNTKQHGKTKHVPGIAVQTIKASTQRNYGKHIRTWGKWIKRSGYAAANPFEDLVIPGEDEGEVRDPFTVPEARLLMRDMGLTKEEGVFLACLLYSGARLMEIVWLRREHVYLDKRFIHIRVDDDADETESLEAHAEREKKRGGPIKERYTKNVKTGQRLSRLEDELTPILKPFLAGDPKGYVFSRHFRKRNSHWFTRLVARLCKRAGFDAMGRTIHCLRHTNVCMLDAAGLGPASLMDHIGHESLKITRKYATHISLMRSDCEHWPRRICLRSEPVANGGQPKPEAAPAVAPVLLHAVTSCNNGATGPAKSRAKARGEGGDRARCGIAVSRKGSDDNVQASALLVTSQNNPKETAVFRWQLASTPATPLNYGVQNSTEARAASSVVALSWSTPPLAPEQ